MEMKKAEELESERGQEKLDWILLALKMGGAHKAKEYGQLLGTGKDKKTVSPLETHEEARCCPPLANWHNATDFIHLAPRNERE